jgi:hypothetical protein
MLEMPDYFKTIQFIMLVLQKRQKECLQEVLDQLLPVVWMCTLRIPKHGGSMIMLAKEQTSYNACKTYGGFT